MFFDRLFHISINFVYFTTVFKLTAAQHDSVISVFSLIFCLLKKNLIFQVLISVSVSNAYSFEHGYFFFLCFEAIGRHASLLVQSKRVFLENTTNIVVIKKRTKQKRI